jgi:hypothetical protein
VTGVDVQEAISRAHRAEWARVAAALARRFGDLDIAEETVVDVCEHAAAGKVQDADVLRVGVVVAKHMSASKPDPARGSVLVAADRHSPQVDADRDGEGGDDNQSPPDRGLKRRLNRSTCVPAGIGGASGRLANTPHKLHLAAHPPSR